jgi:hypothetical protein
LIAWTASKAQAIEAIFLQPVQRVVEEEVAHLRRSKSIAGPHGVFTPSRKNGLAYCAQIIAVRSEVVIDHVEEDHQTETMRGVDQCLQFIGRAVGRIGRVGQHAVVTPIAAAAEVVERHQFDGRHAEVANSFRRRVTPA